MLENILYIVAAYFIGSIPFGFLAGKMRGLDLREHGSKNIGATNAVRVLGKSWGLPVFICDFLKGYLPVLLFLNHLGGDVFALSAPDMAWLLGLMFALIVGHSFTIFLGFKGGKGVATTGGGLLALCLPVGIITIGTWVLSMICNRYVSLSSMLAGLGMIASGVYYFIINDGACSSADVMVIALFLMIFVLVVLKHIPNIRRLMDGTEPKAFTKK